MTDLTDKERRALRLKIADREGDIANAQRDIDAMKRELGSAPVDPVEPGPVEPPPPVVKPSVLPNFAGYNLENGASGKWGNTWTRSTWDETKLSGYSWSEKNARIVGPDLLISVTERNSGQVQADYRAVFTKARWEVDVTLAPNAPGLIQAPLWTYNNETRDELDFEWVGKKGLQLNVYAKGVSVWSKLLFPGDNSGKRHHIALEYDAGKSVIFIMDGVELARVTPADTKGNAFPQSAMKAYIEAWPTMSEGWGGKWLGAGSGLTMTVHGYKQS